MDTITITSPTEFASLCPRILGFVPEDSVVIMGLSGAPTARIDIPTNDDEIVEFVKAVRPAFRHWTSPTPVLIYTDDVVLANRVADTLIALQGVGSIALLCALRIEGDMVYDLGNPLDAGTQFGTDVATGTWLDDREVKSSRADLVAEAGKINDADEAERQALVAYSRGDGARAWVLIDRANHLRGGEQSVVLRDLSLALENANDPR